MPGLNTLRFYAALCVVLAHLENQFDEQNPITQTIALFTLDAQSAVNFFFVLSGFLITLLLLRERAAQGQINIGNFYARRILRIWPLYYLIVFIGLFLFPWLFGEAYPLSSPHPLQFLLVLLLLPNFAGLDAPLAHLWSIGVEEQFYALWPWSARRSGALLRVIAGILILKITLTVGGGIFLPSYMLSLLRDLRFECMAIGALVAFVYMEKPCVHKWLYHPLTQWLAAAVMLCFVLWYLPQTLPVVLISSCSFAIVILNVATNPRAWLRFDNTWGERLGEISYGIYMYHFPLLFLCVLALAPLQLPPAPFLISLYVLTISATLLTAHLSFKYFEKPIQRRRARLARTRSAGDAELPGEPQIEIPKSEALNVGLE